MATGAVGHDDCETRNNPSLATQVPGGGTSFRRGYGVPRGWDRVAWGSIVQCSRRRHWRQSVQKVHVKPSTLWTLVCPVNWLQAPPWLTGTSTLTGKLDHSHQKVVRHHTSPPPSGKYKMGPWWIYKGTLVNIGGDPGEYRRGSW